MSYRIKGVRLEGNDLKRYYVVNEDHFFSPLSKINILVGPNNSGKSRFLRALATMKEVTFAPIANLSRFVEMQRDLTDYISNIMLQNGILGISDWDTKSKELSAHQSIQEGKAFLKPFHDLLNSINAASDITIRQTPTHSVTGNHSSIRDPIKDKAKALLTNLDQFLSPDAEAVRFKRVYIPTLRGLRVLEQGKDLYEERTRSDYFSKDPSPEVFTGQSLYSKLQGLLLGTLEERESVRLFQEFLSDAFFEGQPIALIPRLNQQLEVKIGLEIQRAIHTLGDGIQSVIILTFPLFEYRDKNLLLFIEEPELFMHPGMQRVFVNALFLEECQNAQIFMSTHSNHLLDLTLDKEQIAVFTFHKHLEDDGAAERDSKASIENVSNEDRRTLQLLGILNSSVLLSNCTIWVEGITDRRYLMHCLDLYTTSTGKRAYKQDLHFSFVEYSSSNITHWSFLDKIDDPIEVDSLCGRLFLVTDKDSGKGAKAERAAQLLSAA